MVIDAETRQDEDAMEEGVQVVNGETEAPSAGRAEGMGEAAEEARREEVRGEPPNEIA